MVGRFLLRLGLLLSILITSCLQRGNSQDLASPIVPALTEPTLDVIFPTENPTPTETATSIPIQSVTPAQENSIHPGVIILAWDGAGANDISAMIESGKLPTFRKLAAIGVQAQYLESIEPPLTAPAFSSLATGAMPGKTGIVANQFHVMDDSFYWYRNGFDEPYEDVLPVWVLASRAGFTTATVFYPGVGPEQILRSADYTVGFGIQDAYSRQEALDLQPSPGWLGMPVTYSPALEGVYAIPRVAKAFFLVLDATDDGIQNYDRVVLSTEKRVSSTSVVLAAGEHARLILVPSLQAGAEFLIQEFDQSTLKVYQSGVYHNSAAPRHLLEELNLVHGFFQAPPDMYALEQQWINAEEYLYQIEAHSMWMASVAAWVYDQYQPDLLYTWLDTLDAAGHVFYLRDQRQASYTNELAGQYADYYEQAGITADLALQVIMGKTNLNYDTIIMASDHGMAPVHKAVFVNTILEKAGLLVLDRRDYVIEEKSRAFAVASGGVANIYLNMLGRENPGLVSEGVYAKLQQQIVDLFTALKDPDTGELVFGRVLKREELQRFGLDHAHSGDVWVQANPGYNLDGWRGKNMVFADETTLLGQHGYAAKDEMMRGIFLAAGYGIPGESITIAPISITSVAPTVIELLGIPKPDWMVSNAIDFTRR